MNLKNVVDIKLIHGGIQVLFKFKNGYGASLINHYGSYGCEDGLYEIATIEWQDDGHYDFRALLNDDDYIHGRLTDSMVYELLDKIENTRNDFSEA